MKKHCIVLLKQGQSSGELLKLLPRESTSFFTQETIAAIIHTESKRDDSPIEKITGQRLRSMSSGERKKAVFQYLLLEDKPLFFLEAIYKHLDKNSREKIFAALKKMALKKIFVQVVRKEKEALPFIKDYFVLEQNQLKPYDKPLSCFFKEEKISERKNIAIPKSPFTFENYKTLFDLQGIAVSYGQKILFKNLQWQMLAGSFWYLVGPNGVGKTTLLSMITGDNPKAYGQKIILFDKPKGAENNIWEIKKKIGYFTPNITELFDRRHSTLAMLLSGYYDTVGLYQKPNTYYLHLAEEWLALLNLRHLKNKTFLTLTPVERQLILVARAMVKHPPLLILDEPTAGLDTENARLVNDLIDIFAQESNTGIVYVSHELPNISKNKHRKIKRLY